MCLGFESSNVDSAIVDTGLATLVGQNSGGNEGVVAGVNGGACGEEREGCGGPAVKAEIGKHRVEGVVVGSSQVRETPSAALVVDFADQVMAQRSEDAVNVRARIETLPTVVWVRVIGNNRVADGQHSAEIVDPAAIERLVAKDGAADDGH